MTQLTVIEVNGIKMEVDLRNAKVIENYKVGDNVKVLVKEYSDSYRTMPGVIIGFDQFEKLPTINICYCDVSYSTAEVKFLAFNAKSENTEIVHMQQHEKVLDKTRALDYLEREIMSAKMKVDDLERKRNYFVEQYNQHLKALPVLEIE